MKFICKHCGHNIEKDDRYAGKNIICPNCNIEIIVPTLNAVNETVISKKIYCLNCGARTDASKNICEECGSLLEGTKTKTTSSTRKNLDQKEEENPSGKTTQSSASNIHIPATDNDNDKHKEHYLIQQNPAQRFFHSFSNTLKKYRKYSGRASRAEFWIFVLTYFLLLYIITAIVVGIVTANRLSPAIAIFVCLTFFVLGLPSFIAMSVRRLHDINKSTWWCLIILVFCFWQVPLIRFAGAIVLLVFMLKKGDVGINKYGPPVVNKQKWFPKLPSGSQILTELFPTFQIAFKRINNSMAKFRHTKIKELLKNKLDTLLKKF